ncbi:MAG: peptidylprolyl isomerase [Armatimonadetes bacterium]|nr:peptidylprolyl isomerase [Armatimonadota bacterium]
MVKASSGNRVKVDYTGRLDDGTVFDSSEGREPLEFTLGEGQVIPGFDDGVTGMEIGATKTITIPSDKAYGPHDDDLVAEIDLTSFPPDCELAVGDMLRLQQPDGQEIAATVTDITEKTVTLDANHPLAGQNLTFDVTLVEIA